MKSTTVKFGFLLLLCSTSLQAAFKVPKYETYQLDNGLQVYLMQQSEVPMIDISLVVRAGAIHDGNQFGLANLTAESLQFGSSKFSKIEIEDQLRYVGANLTSGTSKENTTISLSFAKKDTAKVLPIFSDIILKPSFDNTEFDKYKKRFLTQLEQRKERPGSIINDAFARLYFAKHPYGNSILGDSNSVSKIALSGVKSFYKTFYTPQKQCINYRW